MQKTILYFQGTRCEADQKKLAGLSKFITSQRWRLSIVIAPNNCRKLREIINFWKPDGIVANMANGNADTGAVPMVIMGMPPKNYNGKALFVVHDPEATTALAAKELISLGYPNYAFANAINGEEWSPARQRAFENILRLHSKDCAIFNPSKHDERDAITLQMSLRKWVSLLPKPCALYAANDCIGQAILNAAADIGIKVPQDLCVCAVDNDEQICRNTIPPMTSVEPDYFRGGLLTGVLFKEIFENPRKRFPRTPYKFGPVALHRRESTRSTNYLDKTVNDAIEFIHENFNQGIDVRDVARSFTCTRRTAEIRFRKSTGHSILEEILATRLEFALSIIRRPWLSLETVASLSGWKSYSVFRKYFLKATGMTPHDARKKLTS